MVPLGLNMLVDILIAIFTIPWAASGLEGVSNGYNWEELSLRIMAGLGLGLALIFGYVVSGRNSYVTHSNGCPKSRLIL